MSKKYSNAITTFSSKEGQFQFKKEMIDEARMKKRFDVFKGISKFEAVVLSWNKYLNSDGTDIGKTAAGTGNLFLACYVRPLKIQGFLIPPPCASDDPRTQQCIVSLHPVAFSTHAILDGRESSVKVGDIITCYFSDEGPEFQGNLKGLRFDSSEQRTALGGFNLDCLGDSKDNRFKVETQTTSSPPKRLGDGKSVGGKLSDIKGKTCKDRKNNFGVTIPDGVHGDKRIHPTAEATIKANPNNYWIFTKGDDLPADWDIEDYDIEHLMDKGTNHIVQNKKALRLLQFCNRRSKQWKHPPIRITSEVIPSRNGSYRAPVTNLRQCGARGSRHQYGDAYDIYWKDHTAQQKINLLANLYDAGFRGFGFGLTNTHADTRRKYTVWPYPGGKVLAQSKFNKGLSQVK